MQMLSIAIQECRALEAAVWRSRLSSTMSGLRESASAALSSLTLVQDQQVRVVTLTAGALKEARAFQEQSLHDHEDLKGQSDRLLGDLRDLHTLQVKAREQQLVFVDAFGNLTGMIGKQVSSGTWCVGFWTSFPLAPQCTH